MNYNEFVMRTQCLLGANTVIERVNKPDPSPENLVSYMKRLIKINGQDTDLEVVGGLICVNSNGIITEIVSAQNFVKRVGRYQPNIETPK